MEVNILKKLLFILMSVLTLVACNSTEDGTYETISLQDVEQQVQQGYTIVDVREGNEFDSGHIPGAINVPLSQLQASDFAPLSKDGNYIIICRSGNRSQTASELLYGEGYQIVNVSQGMSSWTGTIE